MITDDLAVIVAELERISGLRQLSIEVVANGEAPADVDERNSLLACAEAGVQSVVQVCPKRVAVIIYKRGIGRAGEAKCGRCTTPAGSLDRAGARRSIEPQLASRK